MNTFSRSLSICLGTLVFSQSVVGGAESIGGAALKGDLGTAQEIVEKSPRKVRKDFVIEEIDIENMNLPAWLPGGHRACTRRKRTGGGKR